MRHWNTLVLAAVCVAICAAVADNATTLVCLTRLGEVVEEMNPLTRLLITRWGIETTLFFNTLCSGTVIIWVGLQGIEYRSKFAVLFLLALILIRGYAAWHNFNILLTAL